MAIETRLNEEKDYILVNTETGEYVLGWVDFRKTTIVVENTFQVIDQDDFSSEEAYKKAVSDEHARTVAELKEGGYSVTL